MPGAVLIELALTTAATAKPYRLLVNGTDILTGPSGRGVPVESLSIVDAGWNTPGTLSFLYEDPILAYAMPAGALVQFVDTSKVIPAWSGFLTQRTRVPAFGDQGIAVQCSAIDGSVLLDRNLVDRSITYPAGLSDQAIFQGLIGEFGIGMNAASPYIQMTNPSMPLMTFGDQTLRSAVEQLCAAAQDSMTVGTERHYYVDPGFYPHYFAVESNTAPYQVTDNWNGV